MQNSAENQCLIQTSIKHYFPIQRRIISRNYFRGNNYNQSLYKNVGIVERIVKNPARWNEILDSQFYVYGKITSIACIVYPGCQDSSCKGRADQIGNSQDFQCHICKKIGRQLKRLYLELNLEDGIHKIDVKMFDDEAQLFLGMSAEEISRLSYWEWITQSKNILQACRKQNFKMKASRKFDQGKAYINLVIKDYSILGITNRIAGQLSIL